MTTCYISFTPLFIFLEENHISQKELWYATKIGGSTRQKLRENKCVTTDVLLRICSYLNCDISDILKLEMY